jgi:hypothetical protein
VKIISFAWTTTALLDGRKTVTRRRWTARHRRLFHEGDVVQAYDKAPFQGGKRVALIRLTCDPYQERLGAMPEADVQAEGGLWEDKAAFIDLFGGDPDEVVTVVRFEVVEVVGDG